MEKIETLIKNEIDLESQSPLYIQIADIIRKKIKEGILKKGDELSPEYDLAKALGVSIGTLKKALSILVKEGLIYRRPKLGTFVGRKSEEFAKLYIKNILFILSNHRIPDHHYSVLFSGIEEACRENLFNLQFYSFYDEKFDNLKFILKNNLDGIIVAGRIKKNLVAFLLKEKIPFVLIGEMAEKWNKFYYLPRIIVPIEKIIYNATDYLYKKGHRKIAFIGGDIKFPYYFKMYYGYKNFIKKKRLREIFLYKEGEIDREDEGYQITGEIIKEKPDSILCGNDLIAIGCIERLKEEGLKIPDDVSVMGVGNLSVSNFCFPSLTTIDMNTFLLGKRAVEFLKEIKGEKRNKKEIWDKFEIIERESVKERSKI